MRETYFHYLQLRQELTRWLTQSALMDGPGRNRGGEDEANYALTWLPHYLVTGDKDIVARFHSLLDDLANWVESDGWHGYEPKAEAHHGTEPFLLFLPRYLGLFPDDGKARGLLEDVAHHIGNWADGVPDWYDYERDCFHSYRIGSEVVGGDRAFAYELAEHFRFVHIALAAHRVLGEARYLEWALRYGRQRAERLLEAGDGPIPVLWDLEGRGLFTADIETREQRSMAASSHHLDGDPLAGLENLLASGAIYALGDLYRLSGEQVFRQAALCLAKPLVGELLDPFADPAAAALIYYRTAFGDGSLDRAIEEILQDMPPASDAEWAMIFPQVSGRREPGVGKRNDMIYWGEWSDDGSVQPLREPCTGTLVLAYQLSGDVAFAQRAFKGAATKFAMARRVLRGGREHTDMGGAICSVAAGHGRNWGHGAVTGCYGPLLLGAREVQSKMTPLVEVRDGAGRGAIPEEIVSLVRPPVAGDGDVVFYNGGETEVRFAWRYGDAGWSDVALGVDEHRRFQIVGA